MARANPGSGGDWSDIGRYQILAELGKDHVHAQFDTITGERFPVNRDVDSGAARPLTLVLQPFTPSGR